MKNEIKYLYLGNIRGEREREHIQERIWVSPEGKVFPSQTKIPANDKIGRKSTLLALQS